MLSLLDALTVAWAGAWAVFALRRMARGDRASILPVIVAAVAFTAIPLLLDRILGQPEYRTLPGFYLATRDRQTAIVYDLYVCLVPVVMWIVGRPKLASSTAFGTPPPIVASGWRWVLYALLPAPLVALALAPAPGIYLEYAPLVRQRVDDPAVLAYHNTVALACIVSIVAAAAILMTVPRITPTSFVLLILPWLVLACWLHGKRVIVAILLAALGYVAWERGLLVGRRFIAACVAAVLVLAAFSFAYQSQVRDIYGSFEGGTDVYENVRIDYGRDAQIKMTLFAELHPDDLRILEYRGQSLVFYATLPIPRSAWPDKPLPYAQYTTSALFFSPPRFWGWGMTTSWLEEAVANLGWFGLLAGPMVPALVCRVGDARRRPGVRPLTVLVAILLLALELTAFFPLALIWVVMIANPFRRRSSSPTSMEPRRTIRT